MKVLISESQVDKLKSIFSSLYDVKDYEGVCDIQVDYDEVMDKIVLNIFFDRKFAITNGKNFNRIRKSVINSVGTKALNWLNNKPLLYEHYEDCDESFN
jgi:hypothetical protein